jgi:hypothetical protein
VSRTDDDRVGIAHGLSAGPAKPRIRRSRVTNP